MAALPYIQLYVADYLADTAHLSTLEHGAYLLLIMNYWQRGEPFRAKDERTLSERLARVARLSSDEFASVKPVLEEFFDTSETEWRHARIDRDLDAVHAKSTKARAAAKAGASRRTSERSANAQRTLSECLTDAEQTSSHTDTDTDTDTELEEESTTADAVSSKSAAKNCPYQKLTDLYCSTFPTKPQPRTLSGRRKSAILKGWKHGLITKKTDGTGTLYTDTESGLIFWQRFMRYVATECKFCMEKQHNFSIEWLFTPRAIDNIIDNHYRTVNGDQR